MTRRKSVKGAALINQAIGLSVAGAITAISLTQAPQLLDDADHAVLYYVQQSERSAAEIYQQYARAAGHEKMRPEIMISGLTRSEQQTRSPLGHYCYNSQALQKPLSECP